MERFWFWVGQAGWVAPGLFGCAGVLTVLAVERLVELARSRGPVAPLSDILRRHLAQGDLAAALGMAAANRGTFARVALHVLRMGLETPQTQGAAAAEGLALEIPRLERRLWLLTLVGSIAVLLGLLGAITGLSGYGGVVDPDGFSWATRLAMRQAEGLHATVGGLAVSLFALVLAGVSTHLVRRRVAGLRAETRALLGALTAHRRHLRLQVGDALLRAHVEPDGYRGR